ncbi:unnamed protein product [Mycena citricolor]|uniref:Uncharacterized protein n=1 Tax=Mycena citricolor TaxID=2018698 RepID=A0AAD2HGL6_9AGAR|nr:unnamed protein product [Mycena citricolor]
MQTTMHKMHLLRRLTEPDVSTLSPIHDRSISSLASRPSPAPVDPPSSLPWYNISVVSVSMGITAISPGLRRWISRPCFEEKFVVHVPLDGSIVSRAVPGSSFGVPELEFSGAIDAMAGLLVDERDLSVISASSDVSPVLRSTSLKPQLQVETTEQKVTPPVKPTTSSPTLSVPPTSSPSSPIPSSLISPSSKPAASKSSTTTSRVRFMVEDKDDVVPLGYTIRVKQRREEKARFLREEQERRAFEEEKARQEEERRKREQQRRQWEEEKKAWDKEQRAMEEERKLRIYAEEVAATRLRREQQRAGFPGGASKPTSSNLLAASNSSSSLRSERKRQDPSPVSRPAYDTSRRQASEPTGALHPHTPSASPHTSSPSSSRPASIASRGRGSSRPPSVHTNSSDDQRPSNPRRGSVTSLSVKNVSAFDRSSWSANNPSLMMMPSMPNPMYTMDMPLLPPTPPFMLHQYPAPRSHNSSPARSSSSSQSRQRLPSNSSSQSRQSLHRPPPAQAGPSHQRRSSDDARRMSTPPTRDSQLYGGSLRSHSSTSLARGRSSLPLQELHQQSHPPSPWPGTAPPMATSYSQQQLTPAGRPVHRSTRRQTTIS